MSSRDRRPYLAFAGLVLGYLLVRAATVPFVNDEARAFYMYVLPGNFLPFLAPWDAANHPLLSALAQVSWQVGGMAPFGLRIWSVLAFVIYAWYGWRMGGWLRSRTVRWCFWPALLGAPLLLDFFALFRGYGLGMGFLAMGLFHTVRFLHGERRKDLIAALGAMALAGLAMLSLLIIWYAVFGLIAWVVLRGRNAVLRTGRIAWCLFLGALPLAFATAFLLGLQARGQLYSGSDAGTVDGTIRSLLIFVSGAGSRGWRIAVCLPMAAALVHALWRPFAKRTSERDELARLAAVLLIADILGHEILFPVTGALFPIDRGALYLLPLTIVLLACTLDRLAERKEAFALAALLLLLLPLRSALQANFDSTLLWGDNAIPQRFRSLVEERQQASDRPLILGGSHFIRDTWNFGGLVRHSPSIALDYLDFPQPVCDLLLIDTLHFQPPPGFRTIATTSTGENSLMERIRPLRMRMVLDTMIGRHASTDEFFTLWQPSVAAWRGRAAWVEMDAELIMPERLSGMELVFDLRDTANAQIATRNVHLDQHRSAKDQAVHVAIRIPWMPADMGRVTVFLYDPDRVPYRLDQATVKVREILPDGER
jgi:hypothetical protein